MTRFLTSALVMLLLASPVSASLSVVGDNSHPNSNGLGNFSMLFSYSASDANNATITLQITNTTDPLIGGFLTAMAFGNPSDLITDLTLHSTTLATFDNVFEDVNVEPFGTQDFAVATTNTWIGGGSPNGGIAVGQTATIVLNATGTGLDTISETDFWDAVSTGDPSQDKAQAFIARLRGLNSDPDSDKVPGGSRNLIPEPGSLTIWCSMGIIGLGLRRRRSP